jgi:hypothetical protein
MKTSTQKMLFGLVGKIAAVSLMAICFALFSASIKAQQTLLVNYDFADAVAGPPCTATPLTAATGVTSIFTTSGTDGGTCTIYSGIGMSSPTTGFAFAQNEDGNQSVTVNDSDTDAVYVQFQLSGVSAFRGYKLYFQRLRTSSIDVQYSVDGINFTSFIEIPLINPTSFPPSPTSFPPSIVDLSSITAIDNQPTIYFRLVGKDSLKSRLYLTIDNFQVQATRATKKRNRVRFF